MLIPTASEFPNDDAVIILDKTEWEMKISDNFDLITSKERHIVKKIFKNYNKHSFIKIPIFKGDEIVYISARTIKPDGTIIPVEKSEIYTIEGVEDGSQFYSDMKYKKFTFPGLEEGSIIEYYYKKYVSLPFLRDVWLLQRDIPIIYSEYSLIIPELLMTKGKFTWYYKAYNDKTLDKVTRSEVIQTTSTDWDKQVMFNWIKRDVKAFEHEPMMPEGLSEIPHMRFRPGFWKNWDDLSNWYYTELFQPKLIISEEIKKKSKDLTKNCNDRTSKIRACYDYVKDIRYISINLNNEGIIPNEPVVVLKNQYGDCKDKSILLLSLLKSLDIEAEPVLLLTNNEGSFDKDFPTWNFNHMIITVKDEEDKYLWLDPTAEYTEFGNLPAMDQNIDVLVLHANGTSSIAKTQSPSFQNNKKIVNINIKILENLKSNIEFDIKYFGEDRSNIKHFIENSSEKEINEYCKSMITDEFLNSTINSVIYSDFVSQGFFSLNFNVSNVDMIQKQGDLFFVLYDFLPFI
ncbi:MAG: DUF3857 domain-containing protein, partial [Candidatus Cloacimonadota bacterium]|nr:DUF3857 domain-containing protein [Candidatus Cloacimonadota bacterium]